MGKQFLSKQTLYLQSKTDNIQNVAGNKRSAPAQKTVNEICGWKKPNKSRLKARGQDEGLHLWQKHSGNHLASLKEHQLFGL